jgi:dTDP-4-dehydrorhamnose reductase
MNEPPRILLFGSRGQVGWELARALAPLGRVIAPGRDAAAGSAGADFRDPERLRAIVREASPDAIVNAAAYTAVDAAESDEPTAQLVNATAVGVLAEAAAQRDALLVHYGTDYVFDGSGTQPWTEHAPTGPLNAYGRSKLAGEQAIAASGCRALVLRTSWVYAARGANFLRTILRLATTRDALRVVADQHGAPTGAELIADVTAHCVRRALADPAVAGTYHLAAAGETTWYAYALRIVRAARAAGWPVRVRDEQLAAVPTAEYPTAARRPLNSRLDTTRLRRTFDLELPPWEFGVERVLEELLAAGPPPSTPGTPT